VRARRLAADTARDQATADAERAALRTEHAAARLRWGPAFERSFRTASTAEVAAVWAATQPWVDHDPTAHEAARRAEERLGVLHPELIVRYQQGVAAGLEPVDAMAEATAPLGPSLGDVNAAAAAWAVAGDERGEALRDSAVPDMAATLSVDEHTQGLQMAATHAAISDTAAARAALLGAQAYPRPLTGALGRNVRTTPRPPHFGSDLHHSRGR
jgi:hypothetical protein